VSGVLNRRVRPIVFVSQSVLECHGAVVKTVVKTDALRFTSGGASAGGKSHKNLLGVSQRVRKCPGVSERLRQWHAPCRAVGLMGCQRPNLGIRCNAWCRVCAKSRKLWPTPAKAGDRLGLQRPGTERVTPCLPGRLQRFLKVLVAATHRRLRGCDERWAPRQRRGNDREAG
jgi:hypothetical protein